MEKPRVLDSIRGAIGFRWWEVRWTMRSRWLHARGLTGDFEHGEVTDRSRQLTELWEQKWAGTEPLGYLLRVSHHERWIRFHSLPGSKKYAEDAAEYQEIIRRHRTVLAELLAGSPIEVLVIVTVDWGRRDLSTGWSKRHLPGAWRGGASLTRAALRSAVTTAGSNQD